MESIVKNWDLDKFMPLFNTSEFEQNSNSTERIIVEKPIEKENFDYIKEYKIKNDEPFEIPLKVKKSNFSPRGMDHFNMTLNNNYNKNINNNINKNNINYKIKELPIASKKDEILEAIKTRKVTIIEGGTGCGKSTQICQYIFQEQMKKGQEVNIVVTQPRKISAINLCMRVCAENNWKPGQICGFQVGLINNTSEETKILFCTIGVFLNHIINQKNMTNFTHVILDEVHERSMEIDLTLIISKILVNNNSSNVKLILMSATIQRELFSEYFQWKKPDESFHRAKIITIESLNKNKVEISYQKSEINQDILIPIFNLDLVKEACEIINYEFNLSKKNPNNLLSFLVFLPGIKEINIMKDHLNQMEISSKLSIHILHSLISTDDQNKVFLPENKNKIKIILSTNIGESGITVPDVNIVIDFCLTKYMKYEQFSGYNTLQLDWASQSSLEQRKGRTGRTCDGKVYRMIDKSFYKQLPHHLSPEIKRCTIENLILKIKIFDLVSPLIILANCIEPPGSEKIKLAISTLKKVGALDIKPLLTKEEEEEEEKEEEGGKEKREKKKEKRKKNFMYNGRLTFMGKVMAVLPIDIHLSRFILLSHVAGFLKEAVIISALHSLNSIFIFPSISSKKTNNRCFMNYPQISAFCKKFDFSRNSNCDSITAFIAYITWKDFKMNSNKKDEVGFCFESNLDLKMLRQVEELEEEIEKRLGRLGLEFVNREDFSKRNLFIKLLLGASVYPNYFEIKKIDEKESCKDLNQLDPYNTVYVEGLPKERSEKYKQDLLEIFSLKNIDSYSINISFYSKKAFIQFPRNQNPNYPSKYVYSALIMNQYKIPVEVEEKEIIIEKDDDKKPPKPQLPPSAKELWITHIASYFYFYGTLEKDFNFNNKNYNDLNPPLPLKRFKNNKFCLVFYKKKYYRAEILDENQLTVRLIDVGNEVRNLKKKNFFEISDELLNIPEQALKFKLINLKPHPLLFEECVWSENNEELNKIFSVNKRYFFKIYSIVDEFINVELFDEDGNIYDRIIETGLGVHCEESFVSQLNELKLTTPLQNKNPTIKNEYGDKNTNEKIKLRGPVSPYQATFFHISSNNRTLIKKNSVNSVFVNKNSLNFSPIIMSAILVSKSFDNKYFADKTTILPEIKGLPALLSLIFCPWAEYRLSSDGTEITGALCGLGPEDPSSETPLSPLNDIEFEFDFVIDREDIVQINILRNTIDLVIGMEIFWEKEILKKIQNVFRKRFFKFLNKKRASKKPYSFKEKGQWNKLSKDDYEVIEGEENSIFRIHNLPKIKNKNNEIGGRGGEIGREARREDGRERTRKGDEEERMDREEIAGIYKHDGEVEQKKFKREEISEKFFLHEVNIKLEEKIKIHLRLFNISLDSIEESEMFDCSLCLEMLKHSEIFAHICSKKHLDKLK